MVFDEVIETGGKPSTLVRGKLRRRFGGLLSKTGQSDVDTDVERSGHPFDLARDKGLRELIEVRSQAFEDQP